ncbi:MAG: hypothetical protein LBQ20_08440 [Rhodanobacter sp.]|jgi:hypothetical protein|nr:hypothetical protein [Rhodanobacter sp.]
MKTTIDIADDLIDRARLIQKRDDITLRALVEEGLRLVLDKHAKPVKPYKFEPVVVGEPYRAGMPEIDVNALIAEGYAEREAKISASMDGALGYRHARAVAEEPATYEVVKRQVKWRRTRK